MLHVNRIRLASLLLPVLLLAACGTPPQTPGEPRLRVQAQETEASAQRSLRQGDYPAAARKFAEAARLSQSMDDAQAAARNRLQQARAELAQGQAEAALELAAQVRDARLVVPALLLRVQANLALGRVDAARSLLNRLAPLCGAGCPERGSYWLLRARLAWIDGNVKAAQNDAEAAIPVLREQQEEREVANAWRLVAAARLQGGNTAGALDAAQAALEIDKQKAEPEKIVRDWLLIGDILRRAGKPEAKAAYLRARSVAQAAGLQELATIATEALAGEAR